MEKSFEQPKYIIRAIEHFRKLKPFAYNSTNEIARILTWIRPNEPDDIKAYRIRVFQNELLSPYNKIVIKFNGIKKAEGFSINFPEQLSDTATGEDLKNYTENIYPYYGGFPNWFWNKRFKSFITDANSWTIVAPEQNPESDAMYGMPVCFFVFSENIIDFKDGEYVSWFEGEIFAQAKRMYEFDKKSFRIFIKQTNADNANEWQLEYEIINQTGILTACRAGGFPEEVIEGRDVFTSIIAPIAPFFIKAMNVLSDEDGARINHLHPYLVVHETDPCAVCGGTGWQRDQVPNANGKFGIIVCTACNGERYPSSPFGKLTVRPPLNGEQPVPNPAAYYVERPIELLKYISEIIKDKVAGGFQALGFDFMYQVPLNQSGVAKEFDRTEGEYAMYRMAMVIAEHLQMLYYFMASWRQPALGDAKWKQQVPEIVLPEKFDIVTSDIVRQEMEAMGKAGITPEMTNNMQLIYAKKKFGENSKEYKKILASTQLDPFSSYKLDDKIKLQNSPAIDIKDIYTSLNLPKLLNMAEEQDPEFYEKDIFTQRALIQGIAQNNLPRVLMSRSTPNNFENGNFEVGSSGLNNNAIPNYGY